MHYAQPHPQRIIAVSLAALALGAGGGVAGALILDEDHVVTRSSAPAANVSVEPRDTPAPARVSPASSSSDLKYFPKSGAPIPGRVSPSAEPKTGSLAGTTSAEPERISGVRMR